MFTRPRNAGFTLIETMVVLVISVGLVALMTGLYRSVGQSAIALRGGQQEWMMQRQLREQALHLFSLPKSAIQPVLGTPAEIYLTSWQSKAGGLDGKPALLHYFYDETDRTLYYQEQPLPPWWTERKNDLEMTRLKSDMQEAPRRKVLTGAETLAFSYLAADAKEPRPQRWVREWRETVAPGLLQIQFLKAGKNYALWFEIRATDAD